MHIYFTNKHCRW